MSTISILFLVLSFIGDFFLSRFLPLSYFQVSFFYPCFFLLTSIFGWFFTKNKKRYLGFVAIGYLIGCLLFQTNFFLRFFSFSIVYLFLQYFWDKVHLSLISFFFFLIFSFFLYYFTYFLLLFLFAYPGVSFSFFLVQFFHVLPFNLCIGIVLYFVLGIKCRYR